MFSLFTMAALNHHFAFLLFCLLFKSVFSQNFTTGRPTAVFVAPTATRSPLDVIPLPRPMKDCQQIKISGFNNSGTYKIYPDGDGTNGLYAHCDMTTDGGGWTVIMSRGKRNSVRENLFNRSEEEYRKGFGSTCGDQWIGLNTLTSLTSRQDQEVRFELNLPWAVAETWINRYRYFWIESSALNYRITANEFTRTGSGTWAIGAENINGSIFIFDAGSLPKTCAANSFRGPGWYIGCVLALSWWPAQNGNLYSSFELKIRNPVAIWKTSRQEIVVLLERYNRMPRDCGEVQLANNKANGVYPIYPEQIVNKVIYAFCDLTTEGGGWTTILARGSSVTQRENFAASWDEYESGFGSTCTEGWIGMRHLRELTTFHNSSQELRITLTDWDGITNYAKYDNFAIGSRNDSYRLTVENYSGTAGDSLTVHNGAQFTTFDQDNDLWSEGNCAREFGGGWWYVNCVNSNLNGEFLNRTDSSNGRGIIWSSWKGFNYSLKSVDMKIRSSGFLSMKAMIATAAS